MTTARRIASLVATATALVLLSGASQAFETKAPRAMMIDADSGTVLFSQNANDTFEPASLAKLMTMEVVFDAVEKGQLKLDQQFPVSEHAWRTGGAPSGTSTMFAKLKSSITLDDLIHGVIVQSANDACIVIAEGYKGSDAAFAPLMNERAKALGLKQSTFVNSTGLPASGQKVSVSDLIVLASHIWKTYPQYYPIYGQTDFTWNKITQRNRNPLISQGVGVDGLGAGGTKESGFSIVGSAVRGKARIFFALSGMPTEKDRIEESKKMIQWGFDGFDRSEIFGDGQIVGTAKVFGGSKSRIDLKAAGAVTFMQPVGSTARVSARVEYKGPLVAPIEAGVHVADLTIRSDQDVVQRTPLFTAEAVAVGSLSRRAMDAVEELAIGWLR